jgi:hypothetical protein
MLCHHRCMKRPALLPLQAIRADLQAIPTHRMPVLARMCSISVHTLGKIRSGETKTPSYDTIYRLMPCLMRLQAIEQDRAALDRVAQ